ncbi:phage tail sheath subtilisin-like domain-containing protein [bacterium]|nr:phage tail sheath subtilisin-like domain-containing protein [bacterium]
MAETLSSPGVLARENDSSFIGARPLTFGAAIIGPAVKGPVGIPTAVGSFSQYEAIFGGSVESGSQYYTYLNSIAARNYFSQGGQSLLVTRVVTGSFTSAVTSGSTAGANNSGIVTLGFADANDAGYHVSSFQLSTLSEGTIMNNWSETDAAGGTLNGGTADNLRWEIGSVNTSSGQFSLFIRRGNDTSTQRAILESYNNLSMDPTAPNYVAKAIGNTFQTIEQDGTDYYVKTNGDYVNRSAYVYVSAVNTPTPQYFDNNGTVKPNFTGSMPAVGSGSFASATGNNFENGDALFNQNITATNIQGISPDDYTSSIQLLSNTDDYQFNVVSAPGLIGTLHTQTAQLVSLAQGRTDCISVIDLVPYNSTIGTVTNEAAGYDTSYSATYWPWLQTIDTATGQTVWAPASTYIPAVYAFTDASSDPWFAPAGLIRGALGSVIRAERKLTAGNRDTLYEANVNPIATFPGSGVVVFGQKTLQKRASALDRVNVRRLLIALKGYITQVSDNLVFEQNTIATRNNFLAQVNPYLESVQQRQGLYAFQVVMDETNNTPDVIDRNELVGQIYLQPTKTAEFVILDFNVLPTGATFPE